MFTFQSIYLFDFLSLYECYFSCENSGGEGTLYTEAKMTTKMFVGVAPNGAAEQTSRALFFSNREETNTSSGSVREAPFSWNGPVLI